MAGNAPDTVLVSIVCADDSVIILSFVTAEYRNGVQVWTREPTPEHIDAEIAKASAIFDVEKLPIRSWRIVQASDIPADRTFRNALRDNGTTFSFDLAQSRAMYRDRLREVRASKLAELDVAYQRADEAKDAKAKAKIAGQKQALRDLPQDPKIDKVKTTSALIALWPFA